MADCFSSELKGMDSFMWDWVVGWHLLCALCAPTPARRSRAIPRIKHDLEFKSVQS